MRALVLSGPGHAEVLDVPAPVPEPGEVVIDVQRAGICGTDMELFSGEMQYLHTGHARYPLRIGHEWMGTVTTLGEGVPPSWLGLRVTGDTMVGCGTCRRCTSGRQHVCEFRYEIGVRGGRPGALAEQVAVPIRALHVLPPAVSDAAGAIVEPAANSYRAVEAAGLSEGERLLVFGPGTLGLLCAMFGRARGLDVHLMGRSDESLAFARQLGFAQAYAEDDLPEVRFDTVIDASNAGHLPAKAVEVVEPGRKVVYLGISGAPSLVDTRNLVLADVTAVGVLSGSPCIDDTIAAFATGAVDPGSLVAGTVALEELPDIMAGRRPSRLGPGPKIHVTLT
ncbi:alcohol dehydrogenase catalytic domain-containing protein [Microbacterium resistens]|uniref:zinc-dependent alcohol dehydrogenase n=1 Tax=Microbacterium resistens TaxID=156977 RepID=UPI001C57B9B0|nr:alcohol dehydrogenase catalytic domain-containing protein [Microbacterium resistens]MBW1639735.1 alcohol dehydrogenase catalytic domain-containing protein [Microbacterium resistens]